MKKNTSSIQFFSNVYPVYVSGEKINFDKNSEFIGKITNRSALKKLFRLKYGNMMIERDYIRYLRINPIPGIKEWQIKRFKTTDECAFAERGEKPFGVSIESGDYVEKCKCMKKDCLEFKVCRSDLE